MNFDYRPIIIVVDFCNTLLMNLLPSYYYFAGNDNNFD